jgi:Sulfotransferase domain
MPLEVIGPGFGRTGTNSLKLALEHLGFGPCHHMFEVRDKPELLPAWEAAADGETVDWNKVFSGYRSQVDWPGARYWRELSQYFPKAKVILSVRDPDAWFDSVQATIAPFVSARGKHPSPHVNAIAKWPIRRLWLSYSMAVYRNESTPSECSGSISPRCRRKFRLIASLPSTFGTAGNLCATS